MKLVSLENLSKYNELLNQKTVKSVNSVKPDSNGNVTLGTEKSTFNKVVYDTGYFSITADKTYSFDLTGSDLENVSKDNVNIRLVAKVTAAHYGFEVGDIAQLTTAVDVNWASGNVDICSYIRGNTLYVYSGNDPSLSINNGTSWLQKANVQIKAVLTAFVPSDGSILLIAEDQTNASKLIGLPDGTLTWNDQNIVRSVNGVNADENGNVTIEVPSTDIDTSEFVKSVNGSTPDSTGNISIDIPSTDGMVKSVNSQIPDENGNVVLSLDSSESHQSTDSINEISLDTHQKYHEITLNTSETTLKFIENQNSENNSTVLKLELFIKQGTGTNTVIWPENIKWENGTKPVLSLEKDNVDLISLISLDNGQNFYGFSKAVWLS